MSKKEKRYLALDDAAKKEYNEWIERNPGPRYMPGLSSLYEMPELIEKTSTFFRHHVWSRILFSLAINMTLFLLVFPLIKQVTDYSNTLAIVIVSVFYVFSLSGLRSIGCFVNSNLFCSIILKYRSTLHFGILSCNYLESLDSKHCNYDSRIFDQIFSKPLTIRSAIEMRKEKEAFKTLKRITKFVPIYLDSISPLSELDFSKKQSKLISGLSITLDNIFRIVLSAIVASYAYLMFVPTGIHPMAGHMLISGFLIMFLRESFYLPYLYRNFIVLISRKVRSMKLGISYQSYMKELNVLDYIYYNKACYDPLYKGRKSYKTQKI